MYETNVNATILKEYLSFLIKEGLVEYTTEKRKATFSITPYGLKVLKYFREEKKVLPTMKPTIIP